MGLILGLIGLKVASSAIEKITDTVQDISYERSRRSREREEIQADCIRHVSREETKRDVNIALIEANTLYEIERTRAQAQIMTERARSGFFGTLYSNENLPQANNQVYVESEARFCPYCGKNRIAGDVFCRYCGSKIV